MPNSGIISTTDASRRGILYQGIAILFCVALGVAMIVNTQLCGEAMWFWYGTLFEHGVKLYSGLHMPLQPVPVMETSIWLRLFGSRCIPYELLSVVHILALCLGLFLILRESKWPDWQKALVLAGAFVLTVVSASYRFDDYHVIEECLILYGAVLLLLLARAVTVRRLLCLGALLGCVTGLAITTRVTDGVALLVSGIFITFVVAKQRKYQVAALILLTTAVTAGIVIELTGDTFSAWVSNTIIQAAGSKGGTGSIFAAPFRMFRNAIWTLLHEGQQILISLLAIFAVGALVQRFWPKGLRYLVPLQLCLAAIALKGLLRSGAPIMSVTVFLTVLLYVLGPAVLVRYVIWRTGAGLPDWDRREILVILPLMVWASYSAGAGAEIHSVFFAQFALLLLLIPVVSPFGRYSTWANLSFAAMLAVICISGTVYKVQTPYAWQNYRLNIMFKGRVWYTHPLYGRLYLDRDLLNFVQPVCAEIGTTKTELLSLPYSYPNYFCGITPWHGYVQTFFDTSTRATINKLMTELNTAPPQWIVYQRQLTAMSGAEKVYNHGQPIAQRELDAMIMQKIASGQWQLVDKRDYLQGDGWFIIRTHP